MLAGLTELLAEDGIAPAQVSRLAHATTLVTNTLIESSGAKVGVLTTQGFRDVLEIGRMRRPSLYDLDKDKPSPLATREVRLEVRERVDAAGRVITPLKPEDVERAIARFRNEGIDAVAVCFLHSYANPKHEERAGRMVAAAGLPVSLSSTVSAEYGEFERFSTAVANSYVMPPAHAYLRQLAWEVRSLGIVTPVRMMQSNGGVATVDVAARFPVRLISSGPAAGVIGATILASRTGRGRLISFDMGGTSTDTSLVVDGEPAYASEHEVQGYSLRTAGIDIRSIGAGGGSLARLDRTGSLRVGPESAGADPGPACYGWGGAEPTVTDANLVLGYLDADRFCGGALPLSVAAAKRALERHIAAPRGVSVEEAAVGILKVCVTNMVGAVRTITTERGYDPRDFALVAFGGAGPVHAGFVAAELNIPEVLVLRDPGLLSAKGLLLSNYRTEVYRTAVQPLLDANCKRLNAAFLALESEAVAQLPEPADGARRLGLKRILELCYEGQQNVLPIELKRFPIAPRDLPGIAERLNRRFAAIYGFVPGGRRPQILKLRVLAERKVAIERMLAQGRGGAKALRRSRTRPFAHRKALFPGRQGRPLRVPVFERERLAPGTALAGPALVQEDFSNTVVAPGQRLRVDDFGNLVIATRCAP